ncbi:PREDICTED: uncharacterized protein LOC109470470 isoform X5 [Branchiostoma belcheri]|uniref:Uncharacterized protein LOC109470470 isoform X5 n=1 Tax=Branchiostoma belcheri TaxID=7741 RepID=A0A6P4Z5W7_BRABE|nr:PREDICTED: uncharacterized protein LOC109470470 isoform X5 [Branchiostoma belcheri]
MKNMYLLAFFSLVFLGLCSSGVTGDTVSGKELEALRILHRLSVALKNNGGGIGDAKGGKPDVYDGGPDDDTDEETEDTEGTNLVTEDADGDTEGTDGDTEGTDGDADGDTEDTNGDSEGTDGFTEDADGDAEGTDTVTGDADGDAEGTDGDTGGTDGDTGDANGDAEGTDGDAGGDAGDADGDAGDADRDAGDADGDAGDADRDAGDADGDTEGTNGDTGDADGDTEGTNGDTGDADGDAEGTDADVSSTRATEKRGQDAEDLENLKRGRSAGADELSFQSRRQNSVVPGEKIIFPGPRDVDDYARMETTLSGDLTSFTLCVHMRSNMASSNQISLVSYALSQHNNELLLFVNGGFQLYIQSDIRMADPPVWDGEWHTVCTTWRSRDGAWQFYVDGDLTASGSGFRVGGRVRRGGTWILGQDQDRVGGGFEASQSFIGELSEVNLWDRVLSSAEIAADCSYHGNVIDWETTNIRVFGEASKAEYHRCARARAPVSELSASTTCSNDYMELSIPEDQLTDIDLNNLHWRPDRNCGATTNGSHYLFRTELYDCGTEVTFGAKYVTFLNTINILGTHLNSGVITREGDIWITSKCNYERKEWVDSTFLPIPGGLNFTEEGFGQLEVRLSMFPTRQYQRQYRADQYPIHLRLRQHVYMQLEVQGHAQKLSVLALNCKATMSPSPNDSLQYQLIRDGCASDPTLKTYDVDDPGKERFGFEAFRFIREVRTVYVHCEVLVCDAADAGSRCAQGCVRRGKRAAGEVDMRGRHMIYQGPIVLDDYKEAEHAVRLVDDQETGPARRGAPWAMLAAGCVLAALALVVLGTAIVQKRSRRGEWAYHGLKDRE